MENVPHEKIPYGKPSPLWQISSNTNSMVVGGGQIICVCVGGGGEKSHRLGTFTIWYFIRGGGEGNPM